ncbi:hypothetical protein [Sodalis-like endosymbiont of Proechinophthirus fluctus]|nr:hypothetical protein [Sodalis-like endosymbiont of Proechinophthirus fluctus]
MAKELTEVEKSEPQDLPSKAPASMDNKYLDDNHKDNHIIKWQIDYGID